MVTSSPNSHVGILTANVTTLEGEEGLLGEVIGS